MVSCVSVFPAGNVVGEFGRNVEKELKRESGAARAFMGLRVETWWFVIIGMIVVGVWAEV